MYNHAPQDYKCPICIALDGNENDDTRIKQEDIFYKDDKVAALINSKFLVSNPGHVIVVPLDHYENLYELPEDISHRIIEMSKKVSLAMKKARKCDGITVRQNNEPASEQHAFHYHMHLVPRFENDGFTLNDETYVSDPGDRIPYAQELKKYL